MSQPLEEVFAAREYIETYYPSDIDQEELLSAIRSVSRLVSGKEKTLDVAVLAVETGLSSEEVENAAIFDFLRRVSYRLLQVFPQGKAVLLDIGGGPTLYQHIPLCLNVSTIIHGEFLAGNREEVIAYLEGRESAYRWDAYFSVTRRLLSEDQSYQLLLDTEEKDLDSDVMNHAKMVKEILSSESNASFEERLKSILRGNVVPCDVFAPSLEADGRHDIEDILRRRDTTTGAPDIISAHFLTESATADRMLWEKGMKHLIAKLVPGGYFVTTAIRNASWYKVGSEKVPAVPVNEESIGRFLREHGIVIEDMEVLIGSDLEKHGYDGMVFVFGKKSF